MRLYLTGSVCIEANGTTLDEGDLPGPKAVLLLVRLAAENSRAVAREDLADLLWTDLPSRWEVGLRPIVSRLRAALRNLDEGIADSIVATSQGYLFALGSDDWVDLAEVSNATHAAETAHRLGRYEHAASSAWVAESIARRGFLEHSVARWAEDKRLELRTHRLRALDILAGSLSALGDHSEAIRHAELAVSCDPFRERSHRRLIAACAAAGDHAAAARAYQHCRSVLASELGIAPSRATTSLYKRAVVGVRR